MADVSEGWALELWGEPIDLDDLREDLKPPFDPWVEEYVSSEGAMLLLRSRSWKGMQTTGEMMDDARRLLDHINGAHLVGQDDAVPISHGATLRFDSVGQRLPVTLSATIDITFGQARMRGRMSTSAQPAEPTASIMQQRLMRAGANGTTSDTLIFLTRADNWFDIYKAMECIESLGGGTRALIAMWPEWKGARQTANCHRHAPSLRHPMPTNAPSLEEVRALVLKAARQIL